MVSPFRTGIRLPPRPPIFDDGESSVPNRKQNRDGVIVSNDTRSRETNAERMQSPSLPHHLDYSSSQRADYADERIGRFVKAVSPVNSELDLLSGAARM
jgi:hypothetical protein